MAKRHLRSAALSGGHAAARRSASWRNGANLAWLISEKANGGVISISGGNQRKRRGEA